VRVVHAPFAVAGHAPALVAAERELGLDSRLELLGSRGLRRELQRWRLLAHALRDADVVHFNFGSTFLPRYWPSTHRGARAPIGWYARALELRDLSWLRAAKKAIFVTFQGDDVRTADAVRRRIGDAAWLDGHYDLRDDERKRRAAARITMLADGVFALNPDLVPLLPGSEFLPYASVDLRVYAPAPARDNPRPVVVHAPTDRRAKGTDEITAALSGLDVDLRVVENASRDDVRAALTSADVVVDQVRLGWYGGLAVEAMALGRPVIASIDESNLALVPAAMRDELPIVSATADALPSAIATALERRGELARAGRAFVERWHDPLRIAARVRTSYEEAVARIVRR
jgi:glycosyltransferase involved in cell wall biosynthesis